MGETVSGSLAECLVEGDMDLFEAMLSAGADFEKRALGRGNALDVAASQGNVGAIGRLVATCSPGRVLLNEALHTAAGWGETSACEELLRHGAEVDGKADMLYGSKGTTPLLAALQRGKWEAAEFFLKNGADPFAVSTRLSSLSRDGSRVERAIGNVLTSLCDGVSSRMTKDGVEADADVSAAMMARMLLERLGGDAPVVEGRSWQVFAAELGWLGGLRVFADMGALSDGLDGSGMSVLMGASWGRGRCAASVRFLLEECAMDPNLRDENGISPLMFALMSDRCHDTADLTGRAMALLEGGADPEARDVNGAGVADYARDGWPGAADAWEALRQGIGLECGVAKAKSRKRDGKAL